MSRLEELKARIASRDAHIGVIGLGYVGLPLGLEFTKAGYRVTGFEIDAKRVEALNAGKSYIEDVPSDAIGEAVAAGRLSATTDFGKLSGCDVINVCVPTPLTKTKDPDVSYMAAALEDIRKRLRTGQLVILGSTTYPGTAHELFVPMLESTGLRCGVDFALAFAPERIDPANTPLPRCARCPRSSAARRRSARSSARWSSRASSIAWSRSPRRRAPRW